MAFVLRLVPHAPATDRSDAGRTGAHTVRAALADGVSRLLSNEGGVRAGDVEALHQMRVAIRRLRSDLRTLRPLLERDWADALSDAMRPLAASLGAVRDLDVLVERLEGHGADLEAGLRPLTGGLRELRDIARAALIDSLTSADHTALVARIVAAANEPRLAPLADGAAEDVVPTIVTAAWRKLARKGDPLARTLARDPQRPTDAQLHRVRILAKRARYASEAASGALGRRRGRDAGRFAKRLADVQQLLGDHQDATGLIRELRDAVAMRPANAALAFAAGRLMERELAATARDRAAFPGLWAQLRRPKLRRWLDR